MNDSNDSNTEPRLSRSQRRAAKVDESAADAAELARVRGITATGQQFDREKEAAAAVAAGTSLKEFQRETMAALVKRQNQNVRDTFDIGSRPPGDYNLSRALLAQVEPATYMKRAGFEAEVSKELGRNSPLPTSGTLVPTREFFRPLLSRALGTSSGPLGGFTTNPEFAADLFADALRSRLVTGALGARVLPNLSASLVIPRKTVATTVSWLGETAAAPESDPTFGQLAMAPRRVGAYTDISRQLIVQSELAIEQLVLEDLAQSVLVELDRVALFGTGVASQPLGIVNAPGVGTVIGGVNGAQIAWSHILEFERVVAAANALVNLPTCGYAINPASRSWLKRQLKVAAVEGLVMGDDVFDERGLTRLNGYKCAVSTLLPSNLSKGTSTGVCSAAIFGDFSQLLIGLFGNGVELIVDQYTLARSGQVRIVANLFADVVPRYPQAFAHSNDMLTA